MSNLEISKVPIFVKIVTL